MFVPTICVDATFADLYPAVAARCQGARSAAYGMTLGPFDLPKKVDASLELYKAFGPLACKRTFCKPIIWVNPLLDPLQDTEGESELSILIINEHAGASLPVSMSGENFKDELDTDVVPFLVSRTLLHSEGHVLQQTLTLLTKPWRDSLLWPDFITQAPRIPVRDDHGNILQDRDGYEVTSNLGICVYDDVFIAGIPGCGHGLLKLGKLSKYEEGNADDYSNWMYVCAYGGVHHQYVQQNLWQRFTAYGDDQNKNWQARFSAVIDQWGGLNIYCEQSIWEMFQNPRGKGRAFFEHLILLVRNTMEATFRSQFSSAPFRWQQFPAPSPKIDLSITQPAKIPASKVTMHEYQLRNVSRMLDLEKRPISEQFHWPACLLSLESMSPLMHKSFKTQRDWEEDAKRLRGGLLLDDVGKGKTLQCLALIAAEATPTYRPPPTLVLTKKALIKQWESEIKSKTDLACVLWHGATSKSRLGQMTPADVDVVITTHTSIRSSVCQPLLTFAWNRIIVDESHELSPEQVQCIGTLKTRSMWCVTATPFTAGAVHAHHPGSDKLFIKQVALLRLPYHNLYLADSIALLRFAAVYSAAGEEGMTGGHIECRESVHMTAMLPDEKEKYNKVVQESNQWLQTLQAEGTLRKKAFTLVSSTTRHLMYTCAVGAHTTTQLKETTDELPDDVCAICMDPFEDPVKTVCGHWFCHECIDVACHVKSACPMCRKPIRKSSLKRKRQEDNNGSEDEASSSSSSAPWAKLRGLRDVLQCEGYAGKKIVVFSKFAAALKQAKSMLGTSARLVDGSTAVPALARILEDFASPNSGCDVLLVSMRYASVGLNLQMAQSIVFLEPTMNAALRKQAIGRVVRQGQKESLVRVTTLALKDTIEDKFKFADQGPKKDDLNILLTPLSL